VTVDSTQSKWRPATRLGWWAIWLTAAFATMFLINMTVFAPYYDSATQFRQVFLPFYWAFMLSCGLASGILGLVAMARRRERSRLIWLALLVGAFALSLVFLELLGSH
jgi:hypothetical protein